MARQSAARIEIVSTSMAPRSQSRRVGDAVARVLEARGAAVRQFDMRALPVALCDGRELGRYPAIYRELGSRLRAADAIVLAVPVHLYNPSGAALNLLGIVGEELQGKVVGFVSAAGTRRSHLAMLPLISALVFEWHCHVVPDTVQVATGEPLGRQRGRLAAFADAVLTLAAALRAARSASRAA